METKQEANLQAADTYRLCHARRIYVGRDVELFRETFLLPFLSHHAVYRVQGYVLDVSEDGRLNRLLEQMSMERESRADLQVVGSRPEEDSAMRALWRLVADCDPSVMPNELLSDLSPRDYPRLSRACRGLANQRFFGRGPARPVIWPFEQLAGPMGFDQLRACMSDYAVPERPSALIVAAKGIAGLFVGSLYGTRATWLSFVQILDSTSPVGELGPSLPPPDLVFTDIDTFKALRAQPLWSESVWVIAANDRESVEPLVAFNYLEDARQWSQAPRVSIKWSPEDSQTLLPMCVTRPLRRNRHVLPDLSYYQPRPEMEMLRDLWQAGSPYVAGLVGFGGVGKTTLAYRFLKECRTTGDQADAQPAGLSLPTADALFVWDFHTKPFYESFLWSLAEYLNPERASPTSAEQCLTYIRQAIQERYLRRLLLVIDGLDGIQRPEGGATAKGQIQAPLILKLLEEVAGGELPIFALLTTRLEPAELQSAGKAYSSIQIGEMPADAACAALRQCGVRGDDLQLAALANRFGCHAMTIYHLGRLLGDFYDGDLAAADHLPAVQTVTQTGVAEIDAFNRRFLQLFARYEERLPRRELATLQRVAALDMPLSTEVFKQILGESGDKDLGGIRRDELQAAMDALHHRQLLTTFAEPDQELMYYTHPALSNYFGNALTYDMEAIQLGAREYFERRLYEATMQGGWSTIGSVQTGGTVRTRSAAVGPQDPVNQYPTSETALNLMERIIYHTVRAGHKEEARLLYKWRMGGDQHLESIGQVDRAHRIKQGLLGSIPDLKI